MERETLNVAVPALIQWQQTWPSSGHWSAREGTFLGSGVTAMPAGLVCATTICGAALAPPSVAGILASVP